MELAVWQNSGVKGGLAELVAPVGLAKNCQKAELLTSGDYRPQTGTGKAASSVKRTSTAWLKNNGFQPGMEGPSDPYTLHVPPSTERILREQGAPLKSPHQDPAKFLRKTADPMEKVYGNLNARVSAAPKSRETTSAWRPPHSSPCRRASPFNEASQLPRRKTMFYHMYELGHFSFVRVKFNGIRDGLKWTTPIKELPVDYILPFFLEGIREQEEPARYIAVQGMQDLIYGSSKSQLLESAWNCGQSLKDAIQTREPITVTLALIAMRKLIKREPRVVQELLFYLARMASPLALFRGSKLRVQPGYDRRQTVVIGEVLSSVLGSFVKYGGDEAQQIIKRHMPSWTCSHTESQAADLEVSGCAAASTSASTLSKNSRPSTADGRYRGEHTLKAPPAWR